MTISQTFHKFNFSMIKINEQFSESKESDYKPPKRKYQDIPYEKRLKLIKLVMEQKILVSEAAKDLKINLSTAKFIVKSFKKNGRVMKKKTDQLRQKIAEQKEKTVLQVTKLFEEQMEAQRNFAFPPPPYFYPPLMYPPPYGFSF